MIVESSICWLCDLMDGAEREEWSYCGSAREKELLKSGGAVEILLGFFWWLF